MATSIEIDGLTGMFRLLADETRLRILSILRGNELAVGELQKILAMGQSTLSTQLGLLKDQGLVASRKEGQKVLYRIPGDFKEDPRHPILAQALDGAASARWFERDRRNLERALRERSQSSLDFFNDQSNQNRPSPGQSWKSLALGLLKLIRGLRVVDLGCGSGRLSQLLWMAGNQVVGVDNSEAQIALARQSLEASGSPPAGSGSLRFVRADMEDTGLPAGAFDLVVLSQSLHHAARPAAVIQESHRLLAPGGRILILDLLAHDEEWMQKKWGDFWLGFEQRDLEAWLREAGFAIDVNEITGNSRAHPAIEGLVVVGEKAGRGGA